MNYKKGFTLIELLVVIAIIGILSSVVLASLNTAREKGADAATKSNLSGMRAQAELYYDGNTNGYTSVCSSTSGIQKQYGAATTSAGTTDAACESGTSTWAASVKLKPAGKYFCVDSTGFAGELGARTVTSSNIKCQ